MNQGINMLQISQSKCIEKPKRPRGRPRKNLDIKEHEYFVEQKNRHNMDQKHLDTLNDFYRRLLNSDPQSN